MNRNSAVHQDLTDGEIRAAVEKAVKGAQSAEEVKKKMQKFFPKAPVVRVLFKGAHHFEVWFKPSESGDFHRFICPV